MHIVFNYFLTLKYNRTIIWGWNYSIVDPIFTINYFLDYVFENINVSD